MSSHKPTIQTVTEGLAKLIREVRRLELEVAQLRNELAGFTEGKPFDRKSWLPPEEDRGFHTRGATEEPRSAIIDARYEYGRNPNLEAPTRTLLAISRELDGALRDIRSARLDIKAIADDPDLRDSFLEWQQEQRRK